MAAVGRGRDVEARGDAARARRRDHGPPGVYPAGVLDRVARDAELEAERVVVGCRHVDVAGPGVRLAEPELAVPGQRGEVELTIYSRGPRSRGPLQARSRLGPAGRERR